MAQPSLSDLFGSGTTITSENLQIPLASLASVGLSNQVPLSILAAIVVRSTDWLLANEDLAVRATSERVVFSPVVRNNVERTQYANTLVFFGNYQAPVFDPDDLA